MEHISLFFQTVVAVSVLIVWVFRYHNVIAEFEQFGFSDVFRNFVGASKIAISTLLLTGIFYADLTPYAAIGMAAFMLAAQLSHLRVKNPFFTTPTVFGVFADVGFCCVIPFRGDLGWIIF
jgi:hypothetical protein